MHNLLKKTFILFIICILTTSIAFAEEQSKTMKANLKDKTKERNYALNLYYEKELLIPIWLLTESIPYTIQYNNISLKKSEKTANVRIASVGDIMCHNTQYISAYKNGTYDFSSCFNPIKPYIESADLAIGNLETTFSGAKKKYSGYPTFNTPEQLGVTLKEIGFDVITTANNHSLDRRNYGIIHTLDILDQLGLKHTGTFRNKEERNILLIENIKGIKIALISYTYGTNGIPIPKENPAAVNIINKEKMLQDIHKAKEQNVDLIIFSLHFGQEYKRKQNKSQEELVDFLFKHGVDIILGGHPHVIQPAKIKEVTTIDGEKKKCFVIYSQGNFVSDQRKRYTDSGLITILDITKNFKTNKTEIANVSFVPTWVDKSYTKNGLDYRILPIKKSIRDYEQKKDLLLNRKDYQRLQKALLETQKQIF
ncbi:CapA family protein [Crassaminicella indica]|uniref:CapA family protein n=1 Tax=Crassaminicella indica TaxID=2855394 RepID=A0ABX8RDW5_9CLOT|nr:CapA family protein [Crassaminicella indica]QXM06487.1 CapA family protein [Crassaminicella indica]